MWNLNDSYIRIPYSLSIIRYFEHFAYFFILNFLRAYKHPQSIYICYDDIWTINVFSVLKSISYIKPVRKNTTRKIHTIHSPMIHQWKNPRFN